MNTYIDTLFTGLIPAKALSRDGNMLTVEITKTVKAYKKGDITTVFCRDFVRKIKTSGFHTKIATVDTSEVNQ